MATLQERIETATDVLETDAGLMHSIIHGGSTETVETEGGPVPTVAKQVADLEASYAAIDAVAVVAADRQAAETARGGAEDARDAAVAATANMLVKSNNLSDVPDPAAARGNLGVTEAIASALAPVSVAISDVEERTTALETAIGDGQPDYDSGNVSYTNGGLITLSHGLGVTPRDVQVFLKATATNTAGIAVGSMIWKFPNQSYQHQGHMVICDSTSITIRVGTAGIAVFNTSGNAVDASVSAFVLVVHAYKPVSAT